MIKEMILSLIAVGMLNFSSTFAQPNPFSDVPAEHWATDAVTNLVSKGIVEGYGDGTYRGDRNITRYEATNILAKFLASKINSDSDKKMTFKDVPENHWAYRSVQFTSSVGINKGYDDNTFRGEKYITRYEMAQMIANFVRSEMNSSQKNFSPFRDLSENHWANDAVTILASKGIVEGYGNGTFQGDRNITRYEAAVMIAKTLTDL